MPGSGTKSTPSESLILYFILYIPSVLAMHTHEHRRLAGASDAHPIKCMNQCGEHVNDIGQIESRRLHVRSLTTLGFPMSDLVYGKGAACPYRPDHHQYTNNLNENQTKNSCANYTLWPRYSRVAQGLLSPHARALCPVPGAQTGNWHAMYEWLVCLMIRALCSSIEAVSVRAPFFFVR